MPCVHSTDQETKRVPDITPTTRPSTITTTDPSREIACLEIAPSSSEKNFSCPSDSTNIHEEICHVVMIPIVTLIVFANVAVFILSAKSGHFRLPGQWFIASLYIADVLVGVTSIGTVVTSTHESSHNLCLMRLGFFLSSIVATIGFLMLIAVDRFVAITHALTYRKLLTPRVAYLAILVTTIACLLMGFAPLAGWSRSNYDEHCSFAFVLEPEYIVVIMVASLLPILVILVIYIFLYNKARIHIRRIESFNILEQPPRHPQWVLGMSAKGWRCLRKLVALVGCLIVTWSPFILASILDISEADTPCWLKDVISTHFLVLGLTNSLLNPLIYTVCTRDFKHSFRKCFATRMHVNETVT
uniref:G-protein coupled receptors family 1 profile domain-containing protein n=1 Tax=Biomphalaria glabrata TaxID=6526 RepID=A0A2C9LHA5_BIOGL